MIAPFATLMALLITTTQASAPLSPPARTPIRGAHYPALSPDGKRLCFEYQGDLWTVASGGGTATRLTVHRAYDAYPRWSPDGNWIAFSSNREGNYDIFLIPARGGEARQITFHSANDYVQDWSPDGTQILFSSQREGRFMELYTIHVKDGRLRRVTRDLVSSQYGSFSPDGKTIAYARSGAPWWRPKYRGSRNNEIYTIPANGGKTTRLTAYEGWDCWPLYAPDGKSLYFVTDRGGASNLYRIPVSGGKPEPVTTYKDDAVRFPTIARDGSRIAYEYNFDIWVLPLHAEASGTRKESRSASTDGESGGRARGGLRQPSDSDPSQTPNAQRPTPLKIFAPTDSLESAVQRVTLTSGASGLALSPDGQTLAFVARGEIWTVPAGGSEATRLTKTGAPEYTPVWSPDGVRLAYATDRHGNLDIGVMDVKTRAEQIVTADLADEVSPRFSPDGRFLSYVRNGGAEPGLYVLPLSAGGEIRPETAFRVGTGPGISAYDWSPDGRWLVYARRDATATTDLWIVPTVGGAPVNITRYPGSNNRPQWGRDGKYIVFTASRDSLGGFNPPNLYSLELLPPPPRDEEEEGERGATPSDAGVSESVPHPPAHLAGEEEPFRSGREDPTAQRRPAPGSDGATPAEGGARFSGFRVPPRATNVQIDFTDIHNRARPLTSTRDPIGSATLSPDSRTVIYTSSSGGQTGWWALDIQTGSTTRLTAGGETGGDVEFAPDGSRFFFLGRGGTIYQMARGAPAPTPVAFRAVMEIDRRVETAEAFKEAWRTLRTQFYDPKMHGADWTALRARYEPLLSETVAREDFAWLLSAMIGELNASHLGVTPAPDPAAPRTETAALGLTFDQDYAGPGLKVLAVLPKGPTDQTGRRVLPGEYLLAIDGVDVAYNEAMNKTLRDKAGRSVELLVNTKPTREGARTIRVRPISRAAESNLEYEAWVESRRKKVEALSEGQLAYIHIRSMDQASLRRFQRELFGDAQGKKGLVLDVRFNGGGRIHDELLGLLIRRPHGYETPRDGERATQPFQLWNRPTVLLINEHSGSDAEIFPNGFRYYGLGKLVGVPTYGGVIGTTNITLLDGTGFRVPRTGWQTVDGRNMENWGVPPDILVEHTPEDNAADNDRQLETAVKLVLEQIER